MMKKYIITGLLLWIGNISIAQVTLPAYQAVFNKKATVSCGNTAATAAVSAMAIKTACPSATDGVYWINVPGVGAVQTYCLMDSKYDGGGWMLALKATTGNTFNYGANYWTTANTLNPANINRNDGDAKYDVMNGFLAKDMMALWPDIIPSSTESGSIDNLTTWSWLQNSFYSGTSSTLISFFSSVDRRFISDASNFSGKGDKFSSQTDVRFYGFNYRNNPNNARVRWGFGWNENGGGLYPNGNMDSDDVTGGIGLDGIGQNTTLKYSAGDIIGCCQNANGINRSARVELYIR